MTNEDHRAAFEAWYQARFRYANTQRYEHPQYPGDSLPYKSSVCDAAWKAWQAAIEYSKKTMCNRN